MSTPASLELAHVRRRFGPVEALADASLTVRPATVHALLGENGAGKTTLMRIAFGMLRPDAGAVRIAGEPVGLHSPRAALEHGIGMVHQHFTAVPAMTVAENIALGGHGRLRASVARERVRELSERVGLPLDPDARAGDLPVGAQQRLEILKALSRGARVLILDEPTAVLAPAETADLLATLRRFADEGGSVVLITHKLPEALAVADDVTVLRRGRTVLTGAATELSEAALASAMLGGAPPTQGEPLPGTPGHPVITAMRLALVDDRGVPRVHDATLVARAGEVVGVAGVEGAGQRELLRALAGRLRPRAGTLHLPERIGFVPEDRHRDALVLDFSLVENVALAGAGARRGRIPWRAVERRTLELMKRFDVRASGPRAPARALSGGNQQKLVLARELGDAPEAIVVENPTRGLDLAATAAVHRHLLDARDRGAAVVVYSSDLDEVLALADRLVVMFDGRSSEIPVDRDAAGRAMLGLR
ncbi:MAG TPA: ABC transporter ATP-binding protein [Gemmatimonadaceae bacterium]